MQRLIKDQETALQPQKIWCQAIYISSGELPNLLTNIREKFPEKSKIITFWIDDKPEPQRNIVPDLKIDSAKLIENAKERATKIRSEADC